MKTQTFGTEIEVNRISRQAAARAIAGVLSTDGYTAEVRHEGGSYDAWVVIDREGRRWKCVSDASIAGSRDQGTEFVTPVCRWEDLETVQACVRALRAAGAHADASCGIHVHVGLGSHTPRTLRNLVNLVNAKEDLLTQALQISPARRERWCQPVDPDFLATLNRRKPTTSEELARIWYDDRNWEWHAHQHYDPSRYHLLNLHAVWQKGTIEFRAFNSTLHAGEVKAYIQLCLAISHQALTVASASPNRPVTDNPAYTFRCWLLRLGMNGEEFKTARTHRPDTPPEAPARERRLEERCRDHPPGFLIEPGTHRPPLGGSGWGLPDREPPPGATRLLNQDGHSPGKEHTMYESDYEDEAQFTEETLQDGLRELITEGYDSSEICWENLRVRTFAEEGVLTYNKGLVISLPDGTEFQLTIVQSR